MTRTNPKHQQFADDLLWQLLMQCVVGLVGQFWWQQFTEFTMIAQSCSTQSLILDAHKTFNQIFSLRDGLQQTGIHKICPLSTNLGYSIIIINIPIILTSIMFSMKKRSIMRPWMGIWWWSKEFATLIRTTVDNSAIRATLPRHLTHKVQTRA